MSNTVQCSGTSSVDLVSHLQYQFYNLDMAVIGMIPAIKFMRVRAHNVKQAVRTSRLP